MECAQIEGLQKKAIPLVKNSSYISHTTPLFVEEKLLKVQEIFKLKLLKFYYKLCKNLLPPYFDSYCDVIDKEPPRSLHQHFIHQPNIKRSYAECTPLFQLIKLINAMRRDPTDTILQTIVQNLFANYYTTLKTYFLMQMTQFVGLKTVLYVKCYYYVFYLSNVM